MLIRGQSGVPLSVPPPSRQQAAALVIAVLGAISAASILWTAPARPAAAWVVPVVVIWGIGVTATTRDSPPLWLAIAAGALVRAALVGTPPWLSDDLYRYVFEGLALNHGHNPFLEAPATLSHLAPELAARVNHPEIPSIYPPVAQVWFRLVAALHPAAVTAQGGMALVDLANVALVYRILALRGRATWPALLYALHPLPVLESASGAHLEPLGVLACLATVLALARRPGWAWLPMSLGIGVKLLPALFVPALFRKVGPARALAGCLAGAAVLIGLATPVLSAGPALFGALGTYTAHWSFNGLLFPLLQPVVGDATRWVLAALGLGVAAAASTREDPARLWLWVGAGFLALSPTVHPWYVSWALVPSLVLGSRGWALAAVALQGSYLVLFTTGDGGWAPQPWLGPLTWGSALVALAAVHRWERDR